MFSVRKISSVKIINFNFGFPIITVIIFKLIRNSINCDKEIFYFTLTLDRNINFFDCARIGLPILNTSHCYSRWICFPEWNILFHLYQFNLCCLVVKNRNILYLTSCPVRLRLCYNDIIDTFCQSSYFKLTICNSSS